MFFAVPVRRAFVLLGSILTLGLGCSSELPVTDMPTPPAARPPEGFYRFDDRFSEASVQAAPLKAASEGLVFTFGDPSTPPWTVGLPSSTCRTENGALVFTTTGPDTITSPDGLGLDGPEVDAVTIEMESNVAGRVDLMWRTRGTDWADELHRLISISVQEPGKKVTYTLRLAGIKAWRHRISDQIRFRLNGPGEIRISSIRFVTRKNVFLQAPAGIQEFSLGSRLRPCLYAQCPATLTYRVHVPDRGWFSAGLGLVDPAPPVTFRVQVNENGTQRDVLTKSLDSADHWEDVQADLTAFAGRDVDITLRADCAGDGQIALWSNPVMYQARAETASNAPSAASEPLNVLVYVIDCLRADHMNTYGYGRQTAPNITSFAETAVRFSRCYSQDTWTRPSMTSLTTGVDSFVHGLKEYGLLVPDKLVLLPEILRKAGYVTCAITENPQTPPDAGPRRAYCCLEVPCLRAEFGENLLKWCELPELTYDLATKFLQDHRAENFFLYVHTMEPHGIYQRDPSATPVYEAPEPYGSMWTHGETPAMRDVYDGCIAYADRNFKRILDTLEELGLRDNTLIILMADHGEAFAEHDNLFGHPGKPYSELIHIPLFISLPGHVPEGRVVKENTALIDVTPTILDYVGLPPCSQFQGLSLRPLIEGNSNEMFATRVIYSSGADWLHAAAAIQGNTKVFDDFGAGKTMLFDLATDDAETRDLSLLRPDTLAVLKSALDKHRETASAQGAALRAEEGAATKSIDVQTQQLLEGLGYLDTQKKK